MQIFFSNFKLAQITVNMRTQYNNNIIAARIVTLSKKSCHITPILHGLNWLTVSERIKFKVLLLGFKCQNNMTPLYLQELIH